MPKTNGPSSKNTVRRFTILDAVVLIAATAVGIAIFRFEWFFVSASAAADEPGLSPVGPSPGRGLTLFRSVAYYSLFSLAVWSVAVCMLRLQRPRPRLRHLALQPGMAACFVALIGLVCGAMEVLVRFTVIRDDFYASAEGYVEMLPAEMSSNPAQVRRAFFLHRALTGVIGSYAQIAFGIAAVWIILAGSRRCRVERSWLDRAGRILGVLWIAVALFLWLSELAEMAQQPIPTRPPPMSPALFP